MIEIELIVGTMGLESILSDKLPKYSKALLDKASSTLNIFRRGAEDFAKMNQPGSLPDENYSLKTFEEITEKLLEDQEMLPVVESLASWPSDLQIELLVLLADVKAYLSAYIPANEVSGALMGFDVPVSDSDKFRFMWQANLVDDIRKFVDLLNAGAITPLESELMRTLFPQTHDYLLIEVMDKMLEAAVDGSISSWEGGWRKQALSGFLNVPIASFTDIMQFQTGMQQKTAGRPKGPGAVQMAQMNLTNNQKVDTRTLDLSK